MHASRDLAAALEPVVGSVYFAPECHANYAALGFAPSAREVNGVAMPDGPAYFTSRGSSMGQVSGEVVAAAFAVFSPAVVVPSVTLGWTLTDAVTICAARREGAVAQLVRILGERPVGIARSRELLTRAVGPLRPEGRPLFSGTLALAMPDDDLAAVWHLGDMLREYRGDSHTAAWVAAGLDATEIGLLSELYWGLPMRSYSRTRAWTDAEFDAAHARLQQRGLVDATGFTSAGRTMREQIELHTDQQLDPVVAALGGDLDELIAILAPWGAAVRAAHGYPASGPHDLAAAAKKP